MAVEQKQVAFLRHDRGELVHDATRDAREFMLRALAEQRLLDRIEHAAGDGFEQRRGGDLQRRAAGKPATERDIGINQRVEAVEGRAQPLEAGDYAARVIRPRRFATLDGPGQINDGFTLRRRAAGVMSRCPCGAAAMTVRRSMAIGSTKPSL